MEDLTAAASAAVHVEAEEALTEVSAEVHVPEAVEDHTEASAAVRAPEEDLLWEDRARPCISDLTEVGGDVPVPAVPVAVAQAAASRF